MDANDENEESRESDSDMVTEDKISTTTTATISPVSTPDVEMSEAESIIGQDKSSIGEDKIQNEALPPIEGESHADDSVCELRNVNDQCSQRECISGEATNQTYMISPIVTTDVEHVEHIHDMRHERCAEATNQNLLTSDGDAMPTADKDALIVENQILLIVPNSSTPNVETKNDQNVSLENNHVEISDQAIVANDLRPTVPNSEQPSMDGTFQVLQI
jgi:hypothetical protein